MKRKTLQLPVSALLLAMMLVLGYVESLLPAFTAIPGVKLGLSNSVLIFAVYMLDIPTAYILMALKVTLSGFLFGNPAAMLYAFAGGLLSLTAMALVSRIKSVPPVAVSMLGGVMHNVGQVIMAMIVLHTPRQMLYYLGILILVGLACGLLTGVAAQAVMAHLKHLHWKSARTRDGQMSFALIALSAAAVLAAAWLAFRQLNTPVAVKVTTATDMLLQELPFRVQP